MKFARSKELPKVAVLLAAYNGMKWIEEQVSTILSQKSVDLHIYISVDYSSDGTFEYCKSLSLLNPNISVLPYGGVFGGAAPNFFRLLRDVDFTNYDFVAFSDQDDIWFDSKLDHGISAFSRYQIDAYSSNVIAYWPNKSKSLIKKSQKQCRFDYIFESAGPGCTFIFTKSLACDFQSFLLNKSNANAFILHDWLLYAFARSKGYRWYIDPNPYMLYRQHHSNQLGANNTLDSFFYRLRLAINGSAAQYINHLLSLISENSIDPVPVRFNLKAYLFFIFNWRHLRRRARDRFVILFSLIGMLFAYFLGFKNFVSPNKS